MYFEIFTENFEHPDVNGEFIVTLYLAVTNDSQPFNLVMSVWDENLGLQRDFYLKSLKDSIDQLSKYAKSYSDSGASFPIKELSNWMGTQIASAMNKTGELD